MIHEKQLKEYNFADLSQYFDHIIESKINGQLSQVTSLFKKLNKEQKKEFLSYLADQTQSESGSNTIYYQTLKYCIELI